MKLSRLFLAGHETTATALTWTWYLLSQNPEVEEKLRTEIEAVLGNRLPTYDRSAESSLHRDGLRRVAATVSAGLGDRPHGQERHSHL